MPSSTAASAITSDAGTAPAVPATEGAPGRRRLDWLDGLRGIAALVVVFEHSLDVLFPEVRSTASPWFDFGRYGVFVFFLISGYIVPASLERRRSVREFWIGRMFRLYPPWALAAVIGLAVTLGGLAWAPPNGLVEHPWISMLAHLTMLQDLLGVPNVVNVFWTLSYEMVFYLLITALFVVGIRRNGAGAGAGLGFAAGAVLVGIGLPKGVLSAHSGTGTVIGAAVLMAGGLLAVMSGRPAARRCGAVALAGTALVLLAFNNRIGGMESMAIIATMFAGAGVHAVQHRRVRRGPALVMLALVPVLTVAAGVRSALLGPDGGPALPASWGWCIAVGAAWLTFVFGLAVRNRRFPRPLPWLGVISYSVYLLHPPIVQLVWRFVGEVPGRPGVLERIGWAVGLVGCVLAASAVVHRYVELPMQGMGRRLARSTRRTGAAPPEPARSETATSVPASAEPATTEPVRTEPAAEPSSRIDAGSRRN
ncbi:acyltransferase family protein [Spirillospora sp. NBC_01491]|uniref:acyltransferase family protein n=1 Tax=Spirillospora sp. NBC_01491 TaxID=2976007 RepID=UPI002E310882|nr:acyltransferase [Spirillospora sp. NBC_01491]